MAKNFEYQAKNRDGDVLKGTAVSASARILADSLREKGYYITALRELRERKSLWTALKILRGTNEKDLALLCKQMAMMLSAGIPLLKAVDLLIAQASHPALKDALEKIFTEIERGNTLTEALRACGPRFPQIMRHMIHAGESGGVLHVILARLSVYFHKEYKMKAEIKTALAYPLFVVFLAFIVVMFILTFVMPVFVTMFDNMQIALPLPTRILLATCAFIQSHCHLLLAASAAVAAGAKYLCKLPAYRLLIDRIMLKAPVFGTLTAKASVARCSRTLGTLLGSGVPIVMAIDIAKNVCGHMVFANALADAQNHVQEGLALSETLRASGTFEPMVIQMISVGEETGNLDEMLQQIADFYEDDVDERIASLNALLQPIILLFLGLIVGGIMISIALPMFDSITYIAK